MLLLTLAKGLLIKAMEKKKDVVLIKTYEVYVGGYEVGLFHLEKVRPSSCSSHDSRCRCLHHLNPCLGSRSINLN